MAAFLLTALSALVVLGRGRIEDELFLAHLGLAPSMLALDPSFFARSGGLLFAIPAALLVFAAEFLEGNPPNEPNQRTLPFGCLPWAAAVFSTP